jgi:hypothetical protein
MRLKFSFLVQFAFNALGACLCAVMASAQAIPEPPDPTGAIILTRGQVPPPDIHTNEGLFDYFNAGVSFNGVYDSTLPFQTIGPPSTTLDAGSWGGQIAGSLNIYHRVQHGFFSLIYGGNYTRYNRSAYENTTGQNLALAYSKILSARWSLRVSEALTYTANQGSTYSAIPSSALFPQIEPFSQRFLVSDANLTLGYRATYRLSYFFGGDFFAGQYRPSQVASYTGVSGVAGAAYRLSRRNTVTLSYTASHMNYDGASSTIQTALLTLSRSISRRWEFGISAGASDVSSSGTAVVFSQGVPQTDFQTGQFRQDTVVPNYSGSINRNGRRTRINLTGGQGVTGGNGVYYTSKNTFVSGAATAELKRFSLAGNAGYSRLSSVANAASVYDGVTYGFSAGYRVRQHIFVNVAYSGWHFPNYGTIGQVDAHRFSFGVTFATKDYPLPF